MKGYLEYIDKEVVSKDFCNSPLSSIFDANAGFLLNSKLVKLFLDTTMNYG
jgi:glyceraldehyde-3-phosphate dehydrogenase/erythrose-4-phosphate dehydrogenase